MEMHNRSKLYYSSHERYRSRVHAERREPRVVALVMPVNLMCRMLLADMKTYVVLLALALALSLTMLTNLPAGAAPFRTPDQQLAVDCLTFMSGADAYRMILNKDYKGLLQRVNSAIEADPSKSQLYDIRGQIMARLQEFDKAENNFNQAIELDPDNAVYYEHRGSMFAGIGNQNQATVDLSKATKLAPEDSLDKKSTPFDFIYKILLYGAVVGVPLLFLMMKGNSVGPTQLRSGRDR